jgi:hypothetical protein
MEDKMMMSRSKSGNRPPVSKNFAEDSRVGNPAEQASSKQRKLNAAEALRLMDIVSEVRRNPRDTIQHAINFELSVGGRDCLTR